MNDQTNDQTNDQIPTINKDPSTNDQGKIPSSLVLTDSLNLGDSGGTNNIVSPISFSADAVNDSVFIDSSARSAPINIHVNGAGLNNTIGDNLFGVGGSLALANYSSLTLTLGTGADHVFVAPSTTAVFSIDGRGPTTGGANGDTIAFAFATAHNPMVSSSSNFAAGYGGYNFSVEKTIGFNGFEQITTDAVAPAPTAGVYDYNAATPGIALAFSEGISIPPSSAFTVVNRTTGVTLASTAFAVTYDNVTRTARLTYAGGTVLPDGRYRVTVNAGAVTDTAGNASSATATPYDFFVLAGDANHDGTVGFDDLILLAQNYNKSGQTFAGGNFNYSSDGLVGFDDLVVISQNYGKTLAPVAQTAAFAISATARTDTAKTATAKTATAKSTAPKKRGAWAAVAAG